MGKDHESVSRFHNNLHIFFTIKQYTQLSFFHFSLNNSYINATCLRSCDFPYHYFSIFLISKVNMHIF